MIIRTDIDWGRLLARWSLAQIGVALGLLVAFSLAGGTDASLPADRAELLLAGRSLGAFRAAMVFDALAWVSMGGTILIFAAFFAQGAPRQALFAAGCGIALVAATLGSTLRLSATSALGVSYAAGTADDRAAILTSYLLLSQIITSHFTAGHLFQALGFGLVASMALGASAFPRWLAVSLLALAASCTTFFALDVVGVFSFPFLILHILVFNIALNAAIAWRCWGGLPATAPGRVAADGQAPAPA